MSMAGLSRRLNTGRAQVWACVLVPLACGLLSLAYGVDANWDLFSTHLYNPHAWLDGRLDTDLAPAGFQTYFNPLLDVPYWWMSQHWPAPWVGFLMGAVHGFNFILLLGVARAMLPDLPDEDRYRLPLLLALAGCLTANFLSVLGNSMGDDATALLVLGSLYLISRHWQRLLGDWRRAIPVLLATGLVAGLGAGLKLTNAPYALALCFGLLTLPLAWMGRLRLAFLFGIGVLAGLSITTGYWWWDMWSRFHNPLFPMFSSLFPNPLSRSIGVADTSWLPKSLLETLFWPFIFSWDSHRVGQVHLRQFIWALAYVLFWWWAVRTAMRRLRDKGVGRTEPRVLYLICSVALGYLIWMELFSIYRYLVPLELLAPLLVFLLLRELRPYATARRATAWALSFATLGVVLGGVSTWGHESWSGTAYAVDPPALDQPGQTTVVVTGNEAPLTWLAAYLPQQLSFIGLAKGFPETKAYVEKARGMIAARGGPVYALVPANRNWRLEGVQRAESLADRWGLTQGEHGCDTLDSLVTHLHLHASVEAAPAGETTQHCRLALLPEDQMDVAAADRASAERVAELLKRYRMGLDPQDCTVYKAHVGAAVYPYQWCRVTELAGARGGRAGRR
jgi:hypothetical protein